MYFKILMKMTMANHPYNIVFIIAFTLEFEWEYIFIHRLTPFTQQYSNWIAFRKFQLKHICKRTYSSLRDKVDDMSIFLFFTSTSISMLDLELVQIQTKHRKIE